ncbi:hypothetical protein DSAG12_03264 [Promethearchaeum syntrophicum]|uniref:Uncharacterized protein n=1 Tax=Promethearchaeum syntrophicum TaxID=2594042 RepID=A0A5B9DFE6_9ARCH|nr:hypothetical protein [Candidatus Prometheoarchaeum syntrophicum]QEE17427.1 hypothetical protein DSAG12_03264 [Candidatus Prometheoarchaeum syntrophicum]
MRKKLKFGFVSVLMLLIGFNSIPPVVAANGWSVKEREELNFELTHWDEGDIKINGSFIVTIEEINSQLEMIYSVITDLKIDKIDLSSDFEVNGAIAIFQLTILKMVVLLISDDIFDYFKDTLNERVEQQTDFLNTTYGENDSITFNIKKLIYGLEYSVGDTEIKEYQHVKKQWNKNGILEHWENITIKNGEKSGMLIKGSELTIPSFPTEVFISIFAISALGIIVKGKKIKFFFPYSNKKNRIFD